MGGKPKDLEVLLMNKEADERRDLDNKGLG